MSPLGIFPGSPLRLSFADLLVLGVACLMFLVVGAPLASHAREYTYNIKCASNLKQIAEGLFNYARQNRGKFPRAVAEEDPKAWAAYTQPLAANPFEPGGPAPNDATAALFLLLRTQSLSPDVFVCPVTRKITPWDFGGPPRTAADCSNFPGGEHLSYSYASPYPSARAVENGYKLNSSLSAEFAIMADINPGVPELLTATANDSRSAIKRVNSQNHFRGDGQIVLFGDAHTEYLQNPFVGVQRDNIYTFGASRGVNGGEGIIGSPIDANDSILLPTATVDPGSSRYPPGQAPTWPLYAGLALVGLFVFVMAEFVRRWLSRRAARPTQVGPAPRAA